MGTLDRLILQELVGPFLFGIMAFTVLLVAGNLLFKIADPKGIRPLHERAGLSLGLFALTGVVALVQYSLLSRRVHYGD